MTSTYDSTGIVLDKYADINSGMEDSIKGDLGESINLDQDSFIGHIKEIVASTEAVANEIVQAVFDGGSVANSAGTTLDGNVGIVGVERVGYSYSTIEQVQLTASKPCVVPVGTRYGTEANVVFETDTQVTFFAAGNQTVAATCVTAGPYNVAIGELDQIKTAINGITAVTNLTAATPGRERQTDAEVKESHALAVATSGENDSADIYNALLSDALCTTVKVVDNDTDETVDGVPANTIRVIVIGGTDSDVANAIWNNKTSSVQTYGSESETAYNSDTGQSKLIYFDRGVEVPVYIALNITKQGTFPADGEATILEAYAAIDSAWSLSDDVDYNALVGAAYSVPGVKLNSLLVTS